MRMKWGAATSSNPRALHSVCEATVTTKSEMKTHWSARSQEPQQPSGPCPDLSLRLSLLRPGLPGQCNLQLPNYRRTMPVALYPSVSVFLRKRHLVMATALGLRGVATLAVWLFPIG